MTPRSQTQRQHGVKLNDTTESSLMTPQSQAQ